jgi:Restriction endonuclease fold toxin 5
LIETEKQRRWWFATHPEFSSRRTGQRGEGPDRFGRLPRENPAKEAFIREMAKAGWSRAKAEERWNVYRLNENTAQGVATAMAVHGVGGAARAILTGTYRWAVGLGVAGSIGKSGGPGKWVEVPRRGGPSLEHQSKMAGKPIIERDGKFYIEEFELNGVKFDDYKSGILYEYKHRYTNFIKDGKEFRRWFDGADEARDEALRQVGAAKGMPVIWRVGSDQVKAFRRAIGRIRGVTVKP